MARQIMKISEENMHFICVKDDKQRFNPYRIYETWYDRGNHRKLVISYADFASVLEYLRQTALERGIYK